MKKTIMFLMLVILLSSLSFGEREDDIIIWNAASNSPSRISDIIIWNPAVAVVDSCTYGGSGDFVIDCSDNCEVNAVTDVGGSDVLIEGTGTINITVNITSYVNFDIKGTNESNRCEIHFR